MDQLLVAFRVLLAGLLYGFLGLALYVMWRTLRKEAEVDSAPIQAATLTVQAESTPQQRFALRPVTAIGRSSENHLVLSDPFASSNHAIVVWREGRWWIEDLGSHNGTYVNDERIVDPRPLTTGDRIRVGETGLRFDVIPR
mgnify:CR=1 FL=1